MSTTVSSPLKESYERQAPISYFIFLILFKPHKHKYTQNYLIFLFPLPQLYSQEKQKSFPFIYSLAISLSSPAPLPNKSTQSKCDFSGSKNIPLKFFFSLKNVIFYGTGAMISATLAVSRSLWILGHLPFPAYSCLWFCQIISG